jgi:hypothetical protein
MEEEYAALPSNNSWDLVPHHSSTNVVTRMWLLKHKFADGSLHQYKARWVL